MFMSRLVCDSCDYKSEAFGESIDLHTRQYDLVFQEIENLRIFVRAISENQLSESGIDLDKPGLANRIQNSFGLVGEIFVDIPCGEMEAVVHVKCPLCKAVHLKKTMCGFS